MNILDLLKEVPITEVLRERLNFEQSKAEFEISRVKTERDDFKAERDQFKASLETEQKNHAMTRKELDETRAMIEKFTQPPRPPLPVNVAIPKFKSPI